MAYSTQRVTSDGTLVLLDISITYFNRSEISVLFDGITQPLGTTWNWVGTTEHKISFSPAVANGVEVLVKRTTQLNAPLHDFGGGAAFTAQSMGDRCRPVPRPRPVRGADRQPDGQAGARAS